MKDTWKVILFVAVIVILVLAFDVGGIVNFVLSTILNLFGSLLKFSELLIIIAAVIIAIILLKRKR